ncbi:SA1002 family membrane protein, partial [Lactobacillus acidophilus]|nr:hypothetical protein [Lactobacillus acidophilus]
MQVTTYFVIAAVILAIIIIFRSERKFEFLKAAILFIIQVFFSTINFLIFFVIAFLLMHDRDSVSLGNLFLLLAMFVVFSGIFVYWGMRLAAHVFKFSTTTLTLIE